MAIWTGELGGLITELLDGLGGTAAEPLAAPVAVASTGLKRNGHLWQRGPPPTHPGEGCRASAARLARSTAPFPSSPAQVLRQPA